MRYLGRLTLVLVVVVGLAGAAASALPVTSASAHETPDNAPDTPIPNANPNGAEGFFSAVENSQGAFNSLFRNPTCDAHSIHPPGNP